MFSFPKVELTDLTCWRCLSQEGQVREQKLPPEGFRELVTASSAGLQQLHQPLVLQCWPLFSTSPHSSPSLRLWCRFSLQLPANSGAKRSVTQQWELCLPKGPLDTENRRSSRQDTPQPENARPRLESGVLCGSILHSLVLVVQPTELHREIFSQHPKRQKTPRIQPDNKYNSS